MGARSWLLLLPLLLFSGGCGDGTPRLPAPDITARESVTAQDGAPDSAAPSASGASRGEGTAAHASGLDAEDGSADEGRAQAVPGRETPAEPHLALEGEGLRIFLDTSGSARPIPFGSEAGAALESIERVLGSAPVEQGASPDCGGEYARWPGGLTVRTARNRFVGWSLSGDRAALTTAAGVGIGSTRAEFEEAYVLSVRRTSLGVEFSAGGLAGILASEARDGRVSHMWAGEACIAR